MRRHVPRLALCLLLALAAPLVKADYDLRLLIQSSQLADPSQREAVSLMLHLLPLGGRAGVWAFDQEVRVLAPPGKVTSDWRDAALAALQKAVVPEAVVPEAVVPEAAAGQAGADLPESLATVLGAGDPPPGLPRGLLLVADGRVRVAESPMVNAAASRALLEQVASGDTHAAWPIFTALSRAGDVDLLQALARASGGQALPERPTPAATWLAVLNAALPMTRLPRQGDTVQVPEGIEEVTWLVAADRPDVQILPPGKASDTPETRVRFANYRLRRWPTPDPGAWRISGRDAGRVTVYASADLRPAARGLPTRLRAGEALQGSFQLLDRGGDPAPSQGWEWQARLEGPGGFAAAREIAPASAAAPIPLEFPALENHGWYRLELTVERGGHSLAWQYRLLVEAASTGSSISTRPPELPQANLLTTALYLLAIMALLGLVVAWVLRRRHRHKVALWEQRRSRGREP